MTKRTLIPTAQVQPGTVLLDASGRPRTVERIEPYQGTPPVPVLGVAVSACGYRVTLTATGHIGVRAA